MKVVFSPTSLLNLHQPTRVLLKSIKLEIQSVTRDGNDEKHICPLQLDTIERILHLYSNEGETVLSPFGGIGSEGFCALKMNRNSISIELKESYFKINAKNHSDIIAEKNSTLTLF